MEVSPLLDKGVYKWIASTKCIAPSLQNYLTKTPTKTRQNKKIVFTHIPNVTKLTTNYILQISRCSGVTYHCAAVSQANGKYATMIFYSDTICFLLLLPNLCVKK